MTKLCWCERQPEISNVLTAIQWSSSVEWAKCYKMSMRTTTKVHASLTPLDFASHCAHICHFHACNLSLLTPTFSVSCELPSY